MLIEDEELKADFLRFLEKQGYFVDKEEIEEKFGESFIEEHLDLNGVTMKESEEGVTQIPKRDLRRGL